jgi:penicillin amidase
MVREPILAALHAHVSPDARRRVHLLEQWDGVMSPESPGAAVFALLFAEMMVRATRAKAPRAASIVLGEGFNAVLPHSAMALRRNDHLARCLRDQPSGWFERGWPVEIAAAFAHVLYLLRARFGNRPERWAWGTIRPLVLVHAVGTKPPLGHIFNRGPISFGGDASTIAQASIDHAHPLANPIGIPNLRVTIDVGNWEESRWVLAGGQSGNPLSPHYDDLLELWRRGRGVAIAWSPERVRAVARSTLRLKPG